MATKRKQGRWAVAMTGWVSGCGHDSWSLGDGLTLASARIWAIRDTEEEAQEVCDALNLVEDARAEADYRQPQYRYDQYELVPEDRWEHEFFTECGTLARRNYTSREMGKMVAHDAEMRVPAVKKAIERAAQITEKRERNARRREREERLAREQEKKSSD